MILNNFFIEPLVRQEGEKIILKSDCCLSGCFPQIKETGIIDKFSFCKFSMASRFSGSCLFIFCSETNLEFFEFKNDKKFQKYFPQYKVIENRLSEFFIFLNSGGVNSNFFHIKLYFLYL